MEGARSSATDEQVTEHVSRGRAYTLVFLLRGPNRGQDEATAAAIQGAHLRHLIGLKLEGKLLLNGPLLDDGDLRGIGIYASTDLDEIRGFVEADPAVRAGRLRYEIHPWFGIPGDGLA